jgi:general secretion pathway protein D
VLTSGAGGIFGSGFSFTGNVDGLINAVLSAAESDSDVRILSTPTIVVSHNEEGVVNVSESRPIITSSSSSLETNSTNVRSNVEFRDIGIQLTVTPLIGADGSVQMKIEQTVDNVAGTTEIDGNQQPIIGRREATSTITVNSGEVIILGGLQENRKNDSSAYFPVLGKLPLVKEVFGGDSTDYSRTELIIFVRPTVLSRPGDAQAMSAEKLQAIEGGNEVQQYLDTGTTGTIYMEGSKFEEKPPRKESTKPRSLRR